MYLGIVQIILIQEVWARICIVLLNVVFNEVLQKEKMDLILKSYANDSALLNPNLK